MPRNPMDAFEKGYNVASKGRKPLEGVLDAFDEEQKLSRDMRLETHKASEKQKFESQSPTGVYSWNPLTQAFKKEGTVPKGSVVRNTTTPEDWASKYSMRNMMESPTEAEVTKKTIAEGMVGRIQELKRSLSSQKDESFVPGISSTKMKASLPFGAMDKTAQRYQSVQQALADDLLRLKSGAQINEQEYRRLSNLLTKPWRFDEVDTQNLSDFENQFSKLSQRINRGLLWDGEKFVSPSGEVEEAEREDSSLDASIGGGKENPRSMYNRLRSQGVPPDQARRQAGI